MKTIKITFATAILLFVAEQSQAQNDKAIAPSANSVAIETPAAAAQASPQMRMKDAPVISVTKTENMTEAQKEVFKQKGAQRPLPAAKGSSVNYSVAVKPAKVIAIPASQLNEPLKVHPNCLTVPVSKATK